MKYSVIFSSGYIDDDEAQMKGYRSDVIIRDDKDNYFEVNIVTPELLENALNQDKICYLETNLVIMKQITKSNILLSIKDLDQWLFYKRWKPLSNEQIQKYYFPKEKWTIFDVDV